jgi:enoyl-CoA hydratase/carnithine racemase
MSADVVLYEVADQIATVTLNRPDDMNTINDAVSAQLYEAMQRAAADKDVRAIVLTGAGRAFSAGGDIKGFNNVTPLDVITKAPRLFDMNQRGDYQTRHSYFPTIGKPVVAMINGPAAGIGLLLAMFCDMRFAAEEAVFTTAFARLGLGPEFGTAWILAQLVGHANALDLLMSGRKIRGREAQAMGLVNQAHPADKLKEATYAYVREMVEWCAPSSMQIMKRSVYSVPFQTLHEAIMMANQDVLVTNASADLKEGTASFMAKRRPRFRPI